MSQDGLIHDNRVNCYSLMTTQSVADYLALVERAYEHKGGISFQREALKTTTAKRIRGRMVDDIRRGTVLPPVVIGVVVDDDFFAEIPHITPGEVAKRIVSDLVHSVSIIDGMQRTTALREAKDADKAVADNQVRVECWIARSTDSLIYRMLVLNTGQVPWNLKRQLQVVYSPLISEMKKRVTIERLFTVEEPGRRYKGGEYAADSLVEAFIAFGLRKTEIDTQETLADEFSRLDVVDAISTEKYDKYFYGCLQSMVDIDKAFSRFLTDAEDNGEGDSAQKFWKGRNIFDSHPARIGFMVALAISVLGRVGMDKDEESAKKRFGEISSDVVNFVIRLTELTQEQLGDFLRLDVLSDKMNKKVTNVGRFERNFFEGAFKVLIDERFAVPNMETCWRA